MRRGHFVAGLRGVQFAAPGAVDRLRGMRAHDDDDVRVLSACDPALPWGAALPWPPTGLAERGGARRVAGARVVVVGGRPLLFSTAAAAAG
ncbi:MAG: hypothetical protein U0168_31980 [Nannocystaceae bacterium]